MSKSVFGYFKTKKKFKKKVPMAIKLEGGGKALVAWPLVDELFFTKDIDVRYLSESDLECVNHG